jgi:hypothetical protein
MTADNREPRKDQEPKGLENPWWKSGNMSQIFNTVLEWNNLGKKDFANPGEFHLLVRALGIGKYSGEEDFFHDLISEGRTPLRSISRMRDGNNGFTYTFHRGAGSGRGIPEMYVRDDGLWMPFESGYVYDGQSFSVRTKGFKRDSGAGAFIPETYDAIVGEHITSKETDPYNHTYPLVDGRFLPNGPVSQHHGPGGYARFLYVWDRREGELTLKKVDSVTLGKTVVGEQRTPLDWTDANGQDTNVSIKPYGTFTIPGKMTEQEWLKNLLFPKIYPWYEDTITPRGIIYNEQAFGFNLFDIRFRTDWIDSSIDKISKEF